MSETNENIVIKQKKLTKKTIGKFLFLMVSGLFAILMFLVFGIPLICYTIFCLNGSVP